MKQEFIDVLDHYGNSLGITKTREKIHIDGDCHRVIHLWIYNSNKELLLQKRSLNKETHPGCWDISCAGHVLSFENSMDAVKRELQEELGIEIPKEKIQFIKTFERFQNIQNQEIVDLYLLKEDLNPKDFKFIDHEVADAKFFPLPYIHNFLQGKPENFVVREEYPFILSEIEK